MTVYDLKSGSKIEKIELPVSVALGNFDGLHQGHRELIRQAKCSEYKSCVFTFSRNPFNSPYIMDITQKLEVLCELEVDYACVCDFGDIRDMAPKDFVDEILVDFLNCKRAVCGFDFRFGKDAFGDSVFLKEYLNSISRECVVVDPVLCNGNTVSSSTIRELLSKGKIIEANALLSRPYAVNYHVTHGNGIGVTLGFPTINQPYDEGRVKLPYGVYICRCMGYCAVTNFGIKPTVTDKSIPVFETYIIGYKGDLYGENINVEFYKMIRPEKKFSTFDELSKQIALDVKKAEEYFR